MFPMLSNAFHCLFASLPSSGWYHNILSFALMASTSPSTRKAFWVVLLDDFCNTPATNSYDSCAIEGLVAGYTSVCKEFKIRATAQNFINTLMDLSQIALPVFDIDSNIDNNLHEKKGPLNEVKGSLIIFPRCREIFRLIQDRCRRNNHPFSLTLDKSKQTLCDIGRNLEDAVNGNERFKKMNAHQVRLELAKQRGKVRDLLSRPSNGNPASMDIDSAEDEELPYENEDPVRFGTPARASPVAGPSRLRGDEDAGDSATQDLAQSAVHGMPSTPKRQLSRPESFYQTPPESNRRERRGIGPMASRRSPSSPSPPPRTLSVAVGRTPEPDTTASELARKDHELVELRQENGELREKNGQLQEGLSRAEQWARIYHTVTAQVNAQLPGFMTFPTLFPASNPN
ncbi:hypothetical protein BDZ89DRAFT_1058193 [Hymenopellis radicata]|nr:hypothetical protein BDZ89DRAFT_1058193 [Hymenopellis radicata]